MIRAELEQVRAATGAELVRGTARGRIVGVSTDTRTLRGGELFLALSGPNFDGNAFAARALEAGAAALLLRGGSGAPPPEIASLPADAPVLLHPDPRRALSDLAAWHRSRLAATVVAVTGSCGKTTTKNVLVRLLSEVRRVVGSPNSFNNDVGVPHTLLLADEETEVLVVEMGTNHPGEIAALCRTARPDAGVVTHVGASHLEGLGTVEGVAREKGELPACLPREGFCVLNADCRFTPQLRSRTSARVITFSIEGDGDLNATDLVFHAGHSVFRLDGREIALPLLGRHNVQNCLAALAVCRGLGLDLDDVLPAIEHLASGPGRLQHVALRGLDLYDDSYNANPESAVAGVRVLAAVGAGRRKVLVLGDMLELGEFAAELHHAVGREAVRCGIDRLLLVGELTRAAAAGALEAGMAREAIEHFPDARLAADAILDRVADGDVVLVKGSRRVGLERLVERLTEARGERREAAEVTR